MDQSRLEIEADSVQRYDRYFETCRHLATQISSLLLARSKTMDGKVPTRPLRIACLETFEQVLSARAALNTVRRSDHHALWHIDRAVVHLKRAIEKISTDLLIDRDGCKGLLAAAIRELRFVAVATPGLSLVDLTCACCAPASTNIDTTPQIGRAEYE